VYRAQCATTGGASHILAQHLLNRTTSIESFLDNVELFATTAEMKVRSDPGRLPLAMIAGASGCGKVRCLLCLSPWRFVCLITYQWHFEVLQTRLLQHLTLNWSALLKQRNITDSRFTDAVCLTITYNAGYEGQFQCNDLLARILFTYARSCSVNCCLSCSNVLNASFDCV